MSARASVMLKLVERCNIDCTYCYFFYSNDQSYKKHPPFIQDSTVTHLISWLKQGIEQLNISRLEICFHGGEPLMLKPAQFELLCKTLVEELSPYTLLKLTIQTNGMLVNQIWCDIFEKYRINVGVSLDGPKIYNDIYRKDKRGSGTYDRVVSGINLLQQCKHIIAKGGVNLLCVINPNCDGRAIYRHFFDDLNVASCDFLLPISTRDEKLPFPALSYGKFLNAVFDEWVIDNNPHRQIRLFQGSIASFLGGSGLIYGTGKTEERNDLPLVCVASNGEIKAADDLRNCSELFNEHYDLNNISMVDLLKTEAFQKIEEARFTPPDFCQECCFKKVCHGGSLVTRYSKENEFNNPSSLCDGLYDYYSHVAAFLINNGVSEKTIVSNLGLD